MQYYIYMVGLPRKHMFIDAILHLYGWFVTQTHVHCFFYLPRTHVDPLSSEAKDVYLLCIAPDMHIMSYDRLVFVELHIHN